MDDRRAIAELASEIARLRSEVAELRGRQRAPVFEIAGMIENIASVIELDGQRRTGEIRCDDGSVWAIEQFDKTPHTKSWWLSIRLTRIS